MQLCIACFTHQHSLCILVAPVHISHQYDEAHSGTWLSSFSITNVIVRNRSLRTGDPGNHAHQQMQILCTRDAVPLLAYWLLLLPCSQGCLPIGKFRSGLRLLRPAWLPSVSLSPVNSRLATATGGDILQWKARQKTCAHHLTHHHRDPIHLPSGALGSMSMLLQLLYLEMHSLDVIFKIANVI